MTVNHIWSKYKIKENVTYGNYRVVTKDSPSPEYIYSDEKYPKSYEFDPKTGVFTFKDYSYPWTGNIIYAETSSYNAYFQPISGSSSYVAEVRVGSRFSKGSNYNVDYKAIMRSTRDKIVTKEKGDYIEDIKFPDKNAYPDNGEKNGYWYVYKGIDNQAPTISGDHSNLGRITLDTDITFTVDDTDGDTVTAEVYIDDIKTKNSPFVVELRQQYKIPIKVAEFTKATHKVKVIATDTKGAKSEKEWTFERGNIDPTISGKDEDLGDKNKGFKIPFTVDDKDLSDTLSLTIKNNNKVLKTVNNALRGQEYYVELSDGDVYALAIGELNTITIEVDDGNGGIANRYYYFKRSNTPPVVSGKETEDLGNINTPPTLSFTAEDLEKDELTYSVFLDDMVITPSTKLVGNTIDIKISKKDFSKLSNVGKHKVKLVVQDIHQATTIRTRTFTRKMTSCWYISKTETNAKATEVFLFVDTILAKGAKLTVHACNNVFDTSPTWEDVTSTVAKGSNHTFTNSTKKASKWGIGVKVEINPETSTEPSWITGLGGGYK